MRIVPRGRPSGSARRAGAPPSAEERVADRAEKYATAVTMTAAHSHGSTGWFARSVRMTRAVSPSRHSARTLPTGRPSGRAMRTSEARDPRAAADRSGRGGEVIAVRERAARSRLTPRYPRPAAPDTLTFRRLGLLRRLNPHGTRRLPPEAPRAVRDRGVALRRARRGDQRDPADPPGQRRRGDPPRAQP